MKPNEVTYTTLNNGPCIGGNVVIYHALVEHMKENGCDQPKIHTYINNPLMDGFHKENDFITMAYNALIVMFICRRMGGVSLFQCIQVH